MAVTIIMNVITLINMKMKMKLRIYQACKLVCVDFLFVVDDFLSVLDDFLSVVDDFFVSCG